MSKMQEEPALKLLIIDDEEAQLELIQEHLKQCELKIFVATNSHVGITIFKEQRPEIVLLDLAMPGINGMDILEQIVSMNPSTDVLLMSGHYTADYAVNALKKGAADFLAKPLNYPELESRIGVLIADYRRRRFVGEIDRTLLEAFQLEAIVGRSPQIIQLFHTLRRIAPHFKTTLVTGATGTGKELVARALHRLSPVADKRLVVCNCSALVETLFESELFGYVRGAFTGATQDKIGLFEYADQGTVFLDEIGDMSLAGQAKLLRVLQNNEIQRVGSPSPRKIDVRVIAATHRDLRVLVEQNKFREDLYYRLSMIEIKLPTLADRKEDLPLLQRFFVDKFSTQYGKSILGITLRAQALLARYAWPGNIRELENVIGSACMMVDNNVIDVNDLPLVIRKGTDAPGEDRLLTIEEVQLKHVLRVLGSVGGDKTRAAVILGIARSTLYSILEKATISSIE
jgi:DNA-binding NtrC family response regulator